MKELICGCVVMFLLGCVMCCVAGDMKPWRPDLWRTIMVFGVTLAMGSAVVAVLTVILKGVA